jgi:hypothetical protein
MTDRVTIHYPRHSDESTAAAVTLAGSTARLTITIDGMWVSDVDQNWTRCYSSSGGDWSRKIASVDAVVAEELTRWAARHSDELPHEDATLRPSVRAAGEISFILFRNQPDLVPEYDVGDKASFDLELREVRRSASAPGYSLVWRACGFRVRGEDEDVEAKREEPDVSAIAQLASQVHSMRREMDAIAGQLDSLACHSSR